MTNKVEKEPDMEGFKEWDKRFLEARARLEHHHTWIAIQYEGEMPVTYSSGSNNANAAVEWKHAETRVTKLYCPDCEQTKEVKL